MLTGASGVWTVDQVKPGNIYLVKGLEVQIAAVATAADAADREVRQFSLAVEYVPMFFF